MEINIKILTSDINVKDFMNPYKKIHCKTVFLFSY